MVRRKNAFALHLAFLRRPVAAAELGNSMLEKLAQPAAHLLFRVPLEMIKVALSFEKRLLDDVRSAALALKTGAISCRAMPSR